MLALAMVTVIVAALWWLGYVVSVFWLVVLVIGMLPALWCCGLVLSMFGLCPCSVCRQVSPTTLNWRATSSKCSMGARIGRYLLANADRPEPRSCLSRTNTVLTGFSIRTARVLADASPATSSAGPQSGTWTSRMG
jgi:hypothetical protein